MFRVQDSSLDWALNHVTRFGDTDVFPLPFEYEAIRRDWEDIRAHLIKQDLDNWTVGEPRRMLTPKHDLGFRVATQLDPLDTLLICALIYEIGADFEAARVPVHKGCVYSYRFCPNNEGQLYDPTVNYGAFRERSLELASDASTGLVLMTDIADFFPRLYSHPMENAMQAATRQRDCARIIAKLIKAWNMGVSYGIPVGPSPFRLISELAISDIDEALLAEDIVFCRYSDDYRIFVPNERSARKALAFLANSLLTSHGLTLQGSKTELVPTEEFITRFGRAERDQERHELQYRFREIVAALGLSNGYDSISYDELDPTTKEEVDSLNLWEIVRREAQTSRNLDIPMMRFVLDRIRQLGLTDEYGLLVDNLARFSPVFREVVAALVAQEGLDADESAALGAKLLDLFEHPAAGYLEYHREWLLHAFTDDAALNHTDRLMQLHQSYFDAPTRRAIILALGQANTWHWFKARKQEVFELSKWNQRAFVYAASCLPGDEAKHWYGSIARRFDLLGQAVIGLAKAEPVTP